MSRYGGTKADWQAIGDAVFGPKPTPEGSTMSPDTLARIGVALYGAQWQSALARDLGVSDRSMRRWASGAFPVPVDVPAELRTIVDAHIAELVAVRAILIPAP